MTVAIETFSNVTGGVSFFKAVGHPMAAAKARRLVAELAQSGSVAVYDPLGFAAPRLGCLPRDHTVAVDADALLGKSSTTLAGGYGHMELNYDFAEGGEADGWMHGLFRYEDRRSGHAAEASFGAHIFNTVLTYRNEPQSCSGPAPGLSTRLFLRLGPPPLETLCHLIYTASHDGDGNEIAARTVAIPCGGSLHFRYTETFDAAERARAGVNPYIIVRDPGCRLFGYHGLLNGEESFSLDHMFGF